MLMYPGVPAVRFCSGVSASHVCRVKITEALLIIYRQLALEEQ